MNNSGKKISLDTIANKIENSDSGVHLEKNGAIKNSTGNIEIDSRFNDIHNVNYSERQKAQLENHEISNKLQ
jgi:hypothetical protein